MKPLYRHILRIVPLTLLWGATAATAMEGPFIGLDAGYSGPTNDNYRAHVKSGGTANPYLGYMFNPYLGLQGQFHATFQTPDNDHRGIRHENQTTTILGGTAGPRLVLPLGEYVDVYATGQGGVFSGIHGRVNHAGPGFSVGGGVEINVTPQVAVGVSTRWNHAFESPRPKDLGPEQSADERYSKDIRWLTAGVGVRYAFNGPVEAAPAPAPPPAPRVAQPPPPAPVNRKIVLRGVQFDFDKSAIRADARAVLDEAAATLKAEGGVAVIVEGHTDSKGSDAYNEKLSHRRADAVRQYLISRGVASDRIKTEGLGESRPVASNDTADGRAQNRRVELRLE